MAKQKRQEMWWVILAKSKTLRFFAVSCEFILFLGGLWITFTVNDPSAKTWLSGNVNMIFLTVMGWAIDAAMPEAWLHVVIQHVQKEKGQLSWSKFVACCISVLFIGNIVYSIFTSGDTSKSTGTPTDITAWILLFLTILRITVGFVYLTVRQCQEWIKRDSEQTTATPPAPQQIDQWAFVAWAAQLQSDFQQAIGGLQSEFQKQLAELASNQKVSITELSGSQKQALELFRIEQQRLLGKVQDIENSVPEINYEIIFQAVASRLVPDFQAQFQALETELFRQKTLVSEVQIQAKLLPEKAEFRQDFQAKHSGNLPEAEPTKRAPKTPVKQAEQYDEKIIRLVPANASREELKAEAIRLHEVVGLSSYEIGEKLMKPAKTVQSWLKKEKDQSEERSEEQQEQAN